MIVTVVRVVFYSGSQVGHWSVYFGWPKVRFVGAVYLVDWLDGQCGQVGQVVGMLESSSQYDISNTG